MQVLSDFVSNWRFLVIEFGRLGMRIISNWGLSGEARHARRAYHAEGISRRRHITPEGHIVILYE
jgi:hypothetical protein